MAKNRVVCSRSVFGKGLECVFVRAATPIWVWKGFSKEVFQQFTVFHNRISHHCLDARDAIFDQLSWGKSPPVYSQADEAGPSSATPSTGTPRNAPAMEMPLRLEGCR